MTDTITVIDFSKSIEDINNFRQLPILIQRVIQRAKRIESAGRQELHGMTEDKNGSRLIWAACGHWNGGKFTIDSIGWKLSSDGTHYAWNIGRGVYEVRK